MAKTKNPLSRFFFSIRHEPLISIQMSEDIAETYKPFFTDLFGVKFLQSEYKGDNGTLYYDFEGDPEEIERVKTAMVKISEERIVKGCEIEIGYN